MTLFDVLLYVGFILCGVLLAAPVAFACGQASILKINARIRREYRRSHYGD